MPRHIFVAALLALAGCYPTGERPDRKVRAPYQGNVPVNQIAPPDAGTGTKVICGVVGGIVHYCDAGGGGGKYIYNVAGSGRISAYCDGGLCTVGMDAAGLGGSFDASAYVHSVTGTGPISAYEDAGAVTVGLDATTLAAGPLSEDLSCDGGACKVVGFSGVPICPSGKQPAAHAGQAYYDYIDGGYSCFLRGQPQVTAVQYGYSGELDFGQTTGTETWVAGATAPGLAQATAASGSTPVATTITSQAPYPYSSGGPWTAAQQTPGNIVWTIPPPGAYTGSSSVAGVVGYAELLINSTTNAWMWGLRPDYTSEACMWGYGVTPSTAAIANATLCSFSNNTILNSAAASQIYFRQGGTSVGVFEGSANSYEFDIGYNTLIGGVSAGSWGGGLGGVFQILKAGTNPSSAPGGLAIYADHSTGAMKTWSVDGIAQTIDNGIQIGSVSGVTADMNLTAGGTSNAGNTGANAFLNGGANSGAISSGAYVEVQGARVGHGGGGVILQPSEGVGSGTQPYYGAISLFGLHEGAQQTLSNSSATVTLTDVQSAAYPLLVNSTYDGTCGITSRQPPVAGIMQLVVNTGSYVCTFAWSSGTTVTINAGKSYIVGSDGANAIILGIMSTS